MIVILRICFTLIATKTKAHTHNFSEILILAGLQSPFTSSLLPISALYHLERRETASRIKHIGNTALHVWHGLNLGFNTSVANQVRRSKLCSNIIPHIFYISGPGLEPMPQNQLLKNQRNPLGFSWQRYNLSLVNIQ